MFPDEGRPRSAAPTIQMSVAFQRINWKRTAQVLIVVLCALTLKLYYSSASVNQLRWILAPTTALVQLITRTPFEFESHAGYLSNDRSFVIADSCAGVNFLITSFLLLSLRKLWRARSRNTAWKFIPIAALFAYLATIITNTVRISTALWLRSVPLGVGWLSRNQIHRFEGIFIYFGFLLMLFMVAERMSSEDKGATNERRIRGEGGLFRQSLFPLLIYYVTVLGIPVAHSAYRGGIAATDFWEHSVFVLLTPLLLILPLALWHFYEYRWLAKGARLAVITKSNP
jgi:exosortase K